MVSGPAGCPVATSTNVPTGGWGAIAIVDAGDYPTAAADLAAFSSYYGIPPANFEIKYSGKKPPVYSDWEVEEALDIEWAHVMAPKANIDLIESSVGTGIGGQNQAFFGHDAQAIGHDAPQVRKM